MTHDIIRRLIDDATSTASSSSAGLVEPERRRRAGHGPKIEAAVVALLAEGVPLDTMRPCKRDNLIQTWLIQHGYAGDIPYRATIARWFARRRR